MLVVLILRDDVVPFVDMMDAAHVSVEAGSSWIAVYPHEGEEVAVLGILGYECQSRAAALVDRVVGLGLEDSAI